MKTTPENIAEWKALVPKLLDDSSEHLRVAHSTDMPPQHTVNFRHAKNAHEAAWAITNLIADLEDANASLEAEELMSKTLRHHLMSREAELSGVRKQLSEVQSSKAQWKANHDNVVRKLRLFTQRDDLPVDRLPAYEYVLELEKQLAEAQASLLATARNGANYALLRVGADGVEVSDEELAELLPSSDWPTSALDAAIAEAINDKKRISFAGSMALGNTMRWNCKETLALQKTV